MKPLAVSKRRIKRVFLPCKGRAAPYRVARRGPSRNRGSNIVWKQIPRTGKQKHIYYKYWERKKTEDRKSCMEESSDGANFIDTFHHQHVALEHLPNPHFPPGPAKIRVLRLDFLDIRDEWLYDYAMQATSTTTHPGQQQQPHAMESRNTQVSAPHRAPHLYQFLKLVVRRQFVRYDRFVAFLQPPNEVFSERVRYHHPSPLLRKNARGVCSRNVLGKSTKTFSKRRQKKKQERLMRTQTRGAGHGQSPSSRDYDLNPSSFHY